MRIAPFSFKEFDAGVVTAPKLRPGLKPLLPGGRQKEEAPPPPPPPPSYNEEELAAAKQEAYKKGFEAGTQEGRAQAESEQAAAVRTLVEHAEKFVQSITPLMEDYRQFMLQMREDMPRVALTIGKKVAGPALNENAQAVIEQVALACCQTMIAEPKLVVHVHASLAAELEQKLREMAQRMNAASHIIVASNEQMNIADCRIEWQHGQLERSTEQLWAQVERVITDMVESASHTTAQHIEKLETDLNNPSPEEPPKE